MRKLLGVVYTALALGANTAMAGVPEAEAARAGDMRKLAFTEARALPDVPLLDPDEAEAALPTGQWTVMNFWATWCAPCRKEMPSLDRLQAARPDLAVVTVAAGRNPVPAIQRFFEEAGIERLPVFRDPDMTLARQVGVVGLPVTLILNPDGAIVGRLTGDADWDTPDALAVFDALMQ
ncbi:TlpA family protein disulfide reductase [Falsirhodobacter halotolerans]|uniref:TlpA family protein disulfide reductase n=1 Tax=Falsirhodobacter halotolerans TaxID=1146892 RepID=UPI001FD3E4C5|nr:TlpA disulfide reductase family protein [Falsirhodobacter halotolerans]MCJ8140519.1 TlpA family protein disulfide reductase [Falsirhodobacter halotolerans]